MKLRIVIPTLMLLAVALVPAAPVASAHEHVHIDEYNFTIGWAVEPPYVDRPNAIEVRIEKHEDHDDERHEEEHDDAHGEEHDAEGDHGHEGDHGTIVPVEGADATLKVDVSIAGRTKTFDLRPKFRTPGHYLTDITPTVAGVYSVRVHGALDGKEIDFTVQIEEVRPLSSTQFPEPTPSAFEQRQQFERARGELEDASRTVGDLETRVAALETDGTATTNDTPGFAVLGLLIAGFATALVLRRTRG